MYEGWRCHCAWGRGRSIWKACPSIVSITFQLRSVMTTMGFFSDGGLGGVWVGRFTNHPRARTHARALELTRALTKYRGTRAEGFKNL